MALPPHRSFKSYLPIISAFSYAIRPVKAQPLECCKISTRPDWHMARSMLCRAKRSRSRTRIPEERQVAVPIVFSSISLTAILPERSLSQCIRQRPRGQRPSRKTFPGHSDCCLHDFFHESCYEPVDAFTGQWHSSTTASIYRPCTGSRRMVTNLLAYQ